MTERKSPTAVLREGPRALTEDQVREIEETSLGGVLNVDIDDVIEYVHKDLKSLPDFTTLYRRRNGNRSSPSRPASITGSGRSRSSCRCS
jgi:hypothetical protein